MPESTAAGKSVWTEADLAFLRINYIKQGPTKCGEILGRSRSACFNKAKKLGLVQGNNPWTQDDLNFLEESYGVLPTTEISELLGHPIESVRSKAKSMGLAQKRIEWNEENIAKLNALYESDPPRSLTEIAQLVGVSRCCITAEMKKLGLDTSRCSAAPWTEKDIDFLQKNYGKMDLEEIGRVLNRAPIAIKSKANKLHIESPNANRPWTEEEEINLEALWGHSTLESIAKALDRTTEAVKKRAIALRLGSMLETDSTIKLSKLIRAVCGPGSSYYRIQEKWLGMGLPVRRFETDKRVNLMVHLNKFWEWAEKNRAHLNFAQLEPYALGDEPDWVAEKRAQDQDTEDKIEKSVHRDPWTPNEIARLKDLIFNPKGYERSEIAEFLGRTEEGVKRKITELDLQLRPKQKEAETWDEDTLNTFADMIREMDTWTQISRWLGVSERACKYKAYVTYGTSDLKQLKKIVGDQPWGRAAMPVPIGRQKRVKAVRQGVTALISLLSAETQRGGELYSLKQQCRWWNVGPGCGRCEQGCDYCADFMRLAVCQCDLCGASFTSKDPSDKICPDCATALKYGRPKKKYKKHKRKSLTAAYTKKKIAS